MLTLRARQFLEDESFLHEQIPIQTYWFVKSYTCYHNKKSLKVPKG